MSSSYSVGYLLHGTPDAPSQPGWGGKYARVWDDRKTLPLPPGMTRAHAAQMMIDGRIPAPALNDGRVLRFRFSPRDAKVWPYVIQPGAKSVSRWREDFLRDFAARMARCKTPASRPSDLIH